MCLLPWGAAPQGCAPAGFWCWMPRLTGRLADPQGSPAPSADPRSLADAREEPWTPKPRHVVMNLDSHKLEA